MDVTRQVAALVNLVAAAFGVAPHIRDLVERRFLAVCPRQEFDLKLVERLAKLACTAEEIAAFLETSASTMSRRISEEDSEFCKVYKKGLAEAKRSLRRKQLEVAMKGNPTMLIFLGKNLLGQADKVESKAEVRREGMSIADIIGGLESVANNIAVKFDE